MRAKDYYRSHCNVRASQRSRSVTDYIGNLERRIQEKLAYHGVEETYHHGGIRMVWESPTTTARSTTLKASLRFGCASIFRSFFFSRFTTDGAADETMHACSYRYIPVSYYCGVHWIINSSCINNYAGFAFSVPGMHALCMCVAVGGRLTRARTRKKRRAISRMRCT